MSILDALRVQKANQQSVSQLAMLPQKEIIRLAQMGHIPADVVPVVINEKARMAQEAAQLQASAQMQQGQPPTVIEQAMQANAQAEMPEAGVAALPTDGMFQGQNFQAGGIVAFNGEDGSFVEGPTGLRMLREEATPKRGRLPSLAESIAEAQRMAAPYFAESPEEAALKQARSKGILSKEDMDRQMYMRLAEAGLGIMAGQSPYAFSNIGAGALPALKGYAEDVKAQKAMQLEGLKGAAEAARAKRLEGLKTVELGSQIYGKELENVYRMASLDRNTDFQRRVKNFTPRAMAELGTDDPNDPRVIALATDMADASAGYALGRAASTAATTTAGQDVQRLAQMAANIRTAENEISAELKKITNPNAKIYNNLIKEGKHEEAAEFRANLLRQRVEKMSELMLPASPPTPAQSRPSSGAPTKPDISKVQGAPSGATVGKLVENKGWEVLSSDGKLLGYLQP